MFFGQDQGPSPVVGMGFHARNDGAKAVALDWTEIETCGFTHGWLA